MIPWAASGSQGFGVLERSIPSLFTMILVRVSYLSSVVWSPVSRMVRNIFTSPGSSGACQMTSLPMGPWGKIPLSADQMYWSSSLTVRISSCESSVHPTSP